MEETVEVLPHSVDGIVDAVSTVLRLGHLSKVTIAGGKMVYSRKYMADEDRDNPNASTQVSITELLQNVHMRVLESELPPAGPMSVSDKLVAAIRLINNDQYMVNYIVINSRSNIWMALRIPPTDVAHTTQIAQVPIILDDSVDASTFLVCAAQSSESLVRDVRYIIMGNIDV